ncbi:MAG: type IX secretion system PorP/SprF family membrane protein [Parvicellaceae bacterium]|jgi:type IX secretion system PorP/SprF family membrane protein
MKKLLLIAFGFTSIVYAQDIHFSQVGMTQLQLNPANAGSEFGLRGIVNYRSQWKSVSDPFVSMMASYDMNFKKSTSKTGYFAGGLFVFNDKAGSALMTQTQANLSVAYHVNLTDEQSLGLGVQGGYFQRTANIDQLTWGAQYDGYSYDPTLTSGENTALGYAFGVADFAAGITYTYRNGDRYMTSNDQKLIIAGFSMQHINQPKYAYQDLVDDPLKFRFVGHLNGMIGITNSSFSLQPSALYMRQGQLQEIMAGTNFIYKFKDASKYTGNLKGGSFGIGGHYRFGDAFVLSTLLEIGNYTFGFSYDLNTSSLNGASNGKGAFEFSLRYVAPNPFGGAKSHARFG